MPEMTEVCYFREAAQTQSITSLTSWLSAVRSEGDIRSIFTIWPRSMHQRHGNEQIEPIEFHIRSRLATGVRQDFCALFNFPRISQKLNSHSLDRRSRKADVSLCCGTECQSEQLVLVSFFESIKNRKQWREIGMLSVVRLTRLDSCPHWLAQTGYSSLGTIGTSKTIGVITQGKSEGLCLRRRLLAVSLENSDGINEMIKSSPQIVDNVPDHQSPTNNQRLDTNMSNEAMPGKIAIVLSRDHIGLAISPMENFTLDGLSMFMGSSQFSENACKIEAHQ